ncbi:MAG: hypothetical protein J0I40_05785 [Cellulomonas sp.]|uniref:hypothetical protein n=1 Tax=Cellulomonas sp. 73-92 TaxID=1895740 RepID=UPI000927201C|nr:hypothetical protein [Cellulomonas sp. 73-92]MBN9374894.1 hypothetical protein [Cellulomonas sp.]OJV76499.1 MAG: hypothetical protein BGO37_10600 [Cellulomonas sp. 73-92]
MVAAITDVLDLLGLLLLVAALAVWAWAWHPAAGLAVAGAGLLLVSVVLSRVERRNTRGGGR